MITRCRSLLIALGAVAVAAATSACGTFSDAAATVNGNDIHTDEYEDTLEQITTASLAGITADEETGTVQADAARAVLQLMVRDAVMSNYLADSGESVTDADREEFIASASEQDKAQLEGLPEGLTRLVLDSLAVGPALERLEMPTESELQERYTEHPISIGLLCLRQIVVESEDDAEDVVDELAAGADFAELAEERSIDEASAGNGGALGTDEEACVDLQTARQSLDPNLVAAAFDAQLGLPTGPVETDGGWHVIVARPFDEVSSAIAARYEEQPGALGLAGALATADVSVDPRYGTWNPVSGSIIGLG